VNHFLKTASRLKDGGVQIEGYTRKLCWRGAYKMGSVGRKENRGISGGGTIPGPLLFKKE